MSYIFDRHLYKEGIRQTKGIGFTCFGLSLVATLIMPIYYLYSMIKHYSEMEIVFLSNQGFAGGLRIFAYILPVALMLRLFSFLFKRGSSDFYHALPYRRQCIFFTNIIVAFTWYALSVIIPLVVAGILYGINDKVVFNWSYLGWNIVVYLVMMLFITGAMVIACSIVGKSSVAGELGIFLAFLPRVIMLYTISIIQSCVPLIEMSYIPFFAPKYNLAMELSIGAMVDYAGYTSSFSFVPGILTTLAEAVVYITIGLILFCKRRSEVAENAAPNFKALVAIQVFFFMFLFFIGAGFYVVDKEIEEVIIMFIIGSIFYLGYSLFTLKKIKIAFKTLIGIPVLVVISIGYGFMVSEINNHLLKTIPTAGDVKSIQVLDDSKSLFSGIMGERDTYAKLLVQTYEFSGDDISEAVARDYAYTCGLIEAERLNEYENHALVRITYKDGSTAVRNLYTEKKEGVKGVKELMETKKEYTEAMYSIPDKAAAYSFRISKYNDELWECFKDEYATLSTELKKKVSVTDRGYYSEEIYDMSNPGENYGDYSGITVGGIFNNTVFYSYYKIYEKIMPKTYAKYYELEYLDNYDIAVDLKNIILGNKINAGNASFLYNGLDFEYNGVVYNNIEFGFYYRDKECVEAFIVLDGDKPGVWDESKLPFASAGDADKWEFNGDGFYNIETGEWYYDDSVRNEYVRWCYKDSFEKISALVNELDTIVDFSHVADKKADTLYYDVNAYDNRSSLKYTSSHLSLNYNKKEYKNFFEKLMTLSDGKDEIDGGYY